MLRKDSNIGRRINTLLQRVSRDLLRIRLGDIVTLDIVFKRRKNVVFLVKSGFYLIRKPTRKEIVDTISLHNSIAHCFLSG